MIATVVILILIWVVWSAAGEEPKAPTEPDVGSVAISPGESLLGSFSVFAKLVALKGKLDALPTFLRQPIPSYPSENLNAGVPGKVTVSFVINKEGLVEGVTAKQSTHPAFERESVAAVSQWRFSPPQFSGKPISVDAQVVFIFSVYHVDLDTVLAPSNLPK
jgi:TonB family protein